MKNHKNNIVSLLLMLCFWSCNNSEVRAILDNQNEILALSLNKEYRWINSRNFLFLRTNNGESNNEYYFRLGEEGKNIFLIRDTIQFSPDTVINIVHKDNDSYVQDLCNYMGILLNYMDSFNIFAFNGIGDGGYKKAGIEAVFFLKGGAKVLEYRPGGDIGNVDPSKSRHYKKVADNWYLYDPPFKLW